MSRELTEYIKSWLTIAEHDLLAAQTIIKYEPLVLDTACFHCQQAAEKYLKAFLLYHNKHIEKTHNVDFLIQECMLIDSDFIAIDVKNIND